MGSLSAAAPLGAARACPLPESWSLCLHTSSNRVLSAIQAIAFPCWPIWSPSADLRRRPELTVHGAAGLCMPGPSFHCEWQLPPDTPTRTPGPVSPLPWETRQLLGDHIDVPPTPESSLHVLRSWKMVPTPIVSPRKPASCFSGFPVPHRSGMQNIRAQEGSKDPTQPSRCSQSGEAKRWASDPQATPQ